MKIRNATSADSSLIADAIIEAIGMELARNLAGENNTLNDVHDLFESLALRKDSQYSYLNTRIAVDDSGESLGVCVSYDGADLIALRKSFFKEANKRLGWNISEEEINTLPAETTSDEFYLDTLMTLKSQRGKGIGKALIEDAQTKAKQAGKPLGLLCDKSNLRARKLYESIGFKKVGDRPFAGHDMDHLQMN